MNLIGFNFIISSYVALILVMTYINLSYCAYFRQLPSINEDPIDRNNESKINHYNYLRSKFTNLENNYLVYLAKNSTTIEEVFSPKLKLPDIFKDIDSASSTSYSAYDAELPPDDSDTDVNASSTSYSAYDAELPPDDCDADEYGLPSINELYRSMNSNYISENSYYFKLSELFPYFEHDYLVYLANKTNFIQEIFSFNVLSPDNFYAIESEFTIEYIEEHRNKYQNIINLLPKKDQSCDDYFENNIMSLKFAINKILSNIDGEKNKASWDITLNDRLEKIKNKCFEEKYNDVSLWYKRFSGNIPIRNETYLSYKLRMIAQGTKPLLEHLIYDVNRIQPNTFFNTEEIKYEEMCGNEIFLLYLIFYGNKN